MEFLLLVINQAVVFAWLGAMVSHAKGYGTEMGMWAGALFSVVGLIFLAAVPRRAPSTAVERQRAGLKTCPDCAESVQAAARLCRFCRHEFDGDGFVSPEGDVGHTDEPTTTPTGADVRYPFRRTVAGLFVSIVVGTVIITLWYFVGGAIR